MAQRGTKRGNARVQLIDTALDLFDRHGFHAVGIDKILSAAGLAKMTLYHHFDSKEALIVAVLEKRDAAFREKFTAAVAAVAASAGADAGRAQLFAMFDAIEAWVRDPAFRGSLFDKAAAEYGEKEHPVKKAVLAHKGWLFGEVRRAAATTGAADPVKLAAELFLLMEGAVLAAAVTGDRTAARRAKAAAETLIAAATLAARA
ncbi:MAG TPA: TetR/AcrR family transcriptional regulator [Alphaproteobacteria bacterium]|jgi:AcrR family transcriptional regulator